MVGKEEPTSSELERGRGGVEKESASGREWRTVGKENEAG